MMKFSVIIPTFNDWLRLLQCVTALHNQTLPREQYEIIVVNNNQNGAVPEGINLPEYVQLVHEPKSGSYCARNKGFEMSSNEILAFTDSDCIPDKDWLKNTQKYFDGSYELVGGKVEIFKPEGGSKYSFLYERVTAFHQHKHVPLGKGVTANLFVKREVFVKMNGFETSVKSGGDWHFTLKCTEAGYQMIYADDVLVKHPARDLHSIFKKHHRLTCGGALNTKREHGHSYLRMLGSHIKSEFNGNRNNKLDQLDIKEKAIVYSINALKFMQRSILFLGMMFHFVDPNKIKE